MDHAKFMHYSWSTLTALYGLLTLDLYTNGNNWLEKNISYGSTM